MRKSNREVFPIKEMCISDIPTPIYDIQTKLSLERYLSNEIFENIQEAIISRGQPNHISDFEFSIVTKADKDDKDFFNCNGSYDYDQIDSFIEIRNDSVGSSVRLFLHNTADKFAFAMYSNHFPLEDKVNSPNMLEEFIGTINGSTINTPLVVMGLVNWLINLDQNFNVCKSVDFH